MNSSPGWPREPRSGRGWPSVAFLGRPQPSFGSGPDRSLRVVYGAAPRANSEGCCFFCQFGIGRDNHSILVLRSAYRKPLHGRVHSRSGHAPDVTAIAAGALIFSRSPWNAHSTGLFSVPYRAAPSMVRVSALSGPNDESAGARARPAHPGRPSGRARRARRRPGPSSARSWPPSRGQQAPPRAR
jgi:hypothetical protein